MAGATGVICRPMALPQGYAGRNRKLTRWLVDAILCAEWVANRAIRCGRGEYRDGGTAHGGCRTGLTVGPVLGGGAPPLKDQGILRAALRSRTAMHEFQFSNSEDQKRPAAPSLDQAVLEKLCPCSPGHPASLRPGLHGLSAVIPPAPRKYQRPIASVPLVAQDQARVGRQLQQALSRSAPSARAPRLAGRFRWYSSSPPRRKYTVRRTPGSVTLP